jgi:hypothetical protein
MAHGAAACAAVRTVNRDHDTPHAVIVRLGSLGPRPRRSRRRPATALAPRGRATAPAAASALGAWCASRQALSVLGISSLVAWCVHSGLAYDWSRKSRPPAVRQ